jgi:hypothetical protein
MNDNSNQEWTREQDSELLLARFIDKKSIKELMRQLGRSELAIKQRIFKLVLG